MELGHIYYICLISVNMISGSFPTTENLEEAFEVRLIVFWEGLQL